MASCNSQKFGSSLNRVREIELADFINYNKPYWGEYNEQVRLDLKESVLTLGFW